MLTHTHTYMQTHIHTHTVVIISFIDCTYLHNNGNAIPNIKTMTAPNI